MREDARCHLRAGIPAARACPVVGVPAPGDFAGAAAKVDEYRDEFDQDPGTWSPYTGKGWTGSVTIDPKNGNRQPATVVIVETDANGQLRLDKAWAKAVGAPY